MTDRRAKRPREKKPRRKTPPDIERYILGQRPRHRHVLRLLRKLVKETLPAAAEELKWGQPCYRVGQERVACLYVAGDHVNLGFFQGAELDDPQGLLAGAGQEMRHVKVRFPSDIKRRALTTVLLQAATPTPRS